MVSSLIVRQHARFGTHARLLALFISWLMLVAALPTGSVHTSAARAVARTTKDFSSSSGKPDAEAATTVGASQPFVPDESTQESRAAEAYGKLSLSFEANQGQFDQQVQFLARGGGYGLFLTSSEAVFVLTKPAAGKDRAAIAKSPFALPRAKNFRGERENWMAEATGRAARMKTAPPQSAVLRMKLEGANRSVQAEGLDELPGRTNYFIGNDPQKWHTDIPSYARVMYRDVYPGVDLIYYGREQQLEYDFRVAPGVDPSNIRLTFEGAQSIRVDAQGDLVLHTEAGDVRQHKPVVYQEVDGVRREISSRYEMKDSRSVGFHVDAYDTSKPLVIDPILIYSTFLGGYYSEEGLSIAVDAAGSAYVAGFTASYDFPVTHPATVYTYNFVSKLNRDGSALVYSTYVGGTSLEVAYSIAVDRQGCAYLTGYTYSPDFPVVNALQATPGGKSDPFVTKLSPSGSALIYSTYLGGENEDAGFGIAIDAAGDAYVAGATYSHRFPVVNPFQPKKAGHQAFKSENGGEQWSVSDTGLDASRLDDLIIDPTNPRTLYSATGQGVFKSTNGGHSWYAANRGLENAALYDRGKLALDPAHTSILFFGTYGGLYKSVNGGKSWSLMRTAPDTIQAIAIDPVNTNTIYLSGFVYPANVIGTLYKSTDGGLHWEPRPIFNDYGYEVEVSALAIDPQNSSIVYAGSNYETYKSTDGGDHWKSINRGIYVTLVWNLVIDPSNSAIIYAGTTQGIFKSRDGGRNWREANNGLYKNGVAANIFNLAIDPAHPSVLYAGTFSDGLYKTTDGGAHWSAMDTGLTNERVRGIAIDPTATSKVYVVTSNLADAFVTKLNPSGSARLYSTYLGGDEDEWGTGIAVDREGHAFLVGRTFSSNYPVENPLQPSHGGDAFVTKMDASGSSLVYSTYLGSADGYEEGAGIAVDASGNAYVTGLTTSPSFPLTPGAFQTELKGYVDAFVTKINKAGSNLVYSTLLGGNGSDFVYAIAVNAAGQAFVTGLTYRDDFFLPNDFPVANAIQSTPPGFFNSFVSRLNTAGSSLLFSTYLGGSDLYFEQGNDLAVDSASNVYVTGTTLSVNFPVTPNAFQRSIAGDVNDLYPDAFITKIGAPPASITISGRVFLNRAGLDGVKVTLKNSAGGILQTTTTANDGRYSFTAPGGRDYTVTPSKPGYTFNPPSLSYNIVGTNLPRQNFNAVLTTSPRGAIYR